MSHADVDFDKRMESFLQQHERIAQQVHRVIVGQRAVIDEVLTCLLCGGHALLEGVPGLGKTLLVRTLADAMNLSFSRIQFTPDLMPSDITGTNILDLREGQRQFRFQEGPVFANLVLADEINRATPKTQSAILEAMQEQTVSVARTTYRLPAPFFVLATQNPIEMEGTYPLPEAQLDRFQFKINVSLPNLGEMVEIAGRTTGVQPPAAEKTADAAAVLAMSQTVRLVPVATPVMRYAAALTLATHPGDTSAPAKVRQYVRYGASPRAVQAMVLAGKVSALRAGRANVSFEDIRRVALPAMRHRLILSFEGQAEGITPEAVVSYVLEAVPTPS